MGAIFVKGTGSAGEVNAIGLYSTWKQGSTSSDTGLYYEQITTDPEFLTYDSSNKTVTAVKDFTAYITMSAAQTIDAVNPGTNAKMALLVNDLVTYETTYVPRPALMVTVDLHVGDVVKVRTMKSNANHNATYTTLFAVIK